MGINRKPILLVVVLAALILMMNSCGEVDETTPTGLSWDVQLWDRTVWN